MNYPVNEYVQRAREDWVKKLIDLSRRNNLLYFKDLQTGTLDISAASQTSLARLMQWRPVGEESGAVALRDLLAPDDEKAAAGKLRDISRRAISNSEERGLETLFLALGLATWPAQDDGRPASAPVLLMPIDLRCRGREGRSWTVRRSGEVQVNPVLLFALDASHGVRIAAEQVIEEVQGDDEGEGFDLAPAFERLVTLAGKAVTLQVEPRYVIGNFSFQKMAIVRDLRDRLVEMSSNPIITGIAGDPKGRVEARGDRSDPNPRTFDTIPPDNEFCVLTADSSQQKAIQLALRGQNGVISGPPGTGKSQTIANVIAELAARGKTVLFVAEKRAALDVVFHRLKEVGLSQLCLDLHGADVSRRHIRDQLAEVLSHNRTTQSLDTSEIHRKLQGHRARLNSHVQALHRKREPWNLSVYEIQGALLRLPLGVQSSVRWSEQALRALTPERVNSVRDILQEAAGLAAFFRPGHPSPWASAWLPDEGTVGLAIDGATRLQRELWPTLMRHSSALTAACGLKPPENLAALRRNIHVCEGINAILARYHPALLHEDVHALLQTLAPSAGLLSHLAASVRDANYRRARKRVTGLRIAGSLSARNALHELQGFSAAIDSWQDRRVGGSAPVAYPDVVKARQSLCLVEAHLTPLAKVFPALQLDAFTLSGLESWISELAIDRVALFQRFRSCQIETSLKEHNADRLLPEMAKSVPPPERWPELFHYAWLSSCLEAVHLTLLCHLLRGGFRLKLSARLKSSSFPAKYCSATISRIQARTAGKVGRGAVDDRRRSNCRNVNAAAVSTM